MAGISRDGVSLVNRRFFLSAVALAFVAGCSGSVNTASSTSGSSSPVLYVMTEQQADAVMRQAMAENFQRQPISDVSVPHRGYTAEIFFALDRHAVTLTAVPAQGRDGAGKTVSGYYFEVNHFGSMPLTGGGRARSVLASVEQRVKNTYSTASIQ